MSTRIITGQPPSVGIPVKLKKGQLMLSARQIQYVKAVKKLEIGKDGMDTYQHLIDEGGYWVKTTHTDNEWWAWSLFRIA